MKVSISLPDQDLAFLDAYASENGLPSRSAAVHKAVGALRDADLEVAYTDAFEEWEGTEDEALWETTVSDGLDPADDWEK
jgi:Arc/MetJ-type ribon-helix-helix transcriptional regulator